MILPHLMTYTEDEARSMGYVSITTSYEDNEKEIFDKALETLKGTDHLVVLDRLRRPELFRRKSELKYETIREHLVL